MGALVLDIEVAVPFRATIARLARHLLASLDDPTVRFLTQPTDRPRSARRIARELRERRSPRSALLLIRWSR